MTTLSQIVSHYKTALTLGLDTASSTMMSVVIIVIGVPGLTVLAE